MLNKIKIDFSDRKILIKKLNTTLIFTSSILLASVNSVAQCAMCRASLESEGNVTKVEAVNDGIVYLMIIPYVLVGIVGFLIYRMFSKKPTE